MRAPCLSPNDEEDVHFDPFQTGTKAYISPSIIGQTIYNDRRHEACEGGIIASNKDENQQKRLK